MVIFALIMLFGMLLAAICAFVSLLATAILGGIVLFANLLAVVLVISAADGDIGSGHGLSSLTRLSCRVR